MFSDVLDFYDVKDLFVDFKSMSDDEIGRHFFPRFLDLFEEKYDMTLGLETFLITIGSGSAAKFGKKVRENNINSNVVQDSFRKVIGKYERAIPNVDIFISYLVSADSSVLDSNDVSGAVETVTETAKEVGAGIAEQVKNISKYGIYIVGLALILWGISLLPKKKS